MENETKKVDYWRIILTVTVVGSLISKANQIKNILPFNIHGTALAAILGAAGAFIGYGIYNLVKNKKPGIKIAAFVLVLLILGGSTVIFTKLSSDSYVVKKEWNVIKNGNLSFEYPDKLVKIDSIKTPENCEKMECFFNKGATDRFVMNFVFDFKDEPPAPEDSLSGGVLNALEKLKATDIEWIDPVFYEDAVTTKVKYKIGEKEHLGFGVVYFKDRHYETATFLPNTKDYSQEFLDRIIGSISAEE